MEEVSPMKGDAEDVGDDEEVRTPLFEEATLSRAIVTRHSPPELGSPGALTPPTRDCHDGTGMVLEEVEHEYPQSTVVEAGGRPTLPDLDEALRDRQYSRAIQGDYNGIIPEPHSNDSIHRGAVYRESSGHHVSLELGPSPPEQFDLDDLEKALNRAVSFQTPVVVPAISNFDRGTHTETVTYAETIPNDERTSAETIDYRDLGSSGNTFSASMFEGGKSMDTVRAAHLLDQDYNSSDVSSSAESASAQFFGQSQNSLNISLSGSGSLGSPHCIEGIPSEFGFEFPSPTLRKKAGSVHNCTTGPIELNPGSPRSRMRRAESERLSFARAGPAQTSWRGTSTHMGDVVDEIAESVLVGDADDGLDRIQSANLLAHHSSYKQLKLEKDRHAKERTEKAAAYALQAGKSWRRKAKESSKIVSNEPLLPYDPDRDQFWALPDTIDHPPRLGAAPFGVCPDVMLELRFAFLADGNRKWMKYSLKDPQFVADNLQVPLNKLMGTADTSPFSKITCSWSHRHMLHIPINAVTFVWAYPLLDQCDHWVSSENKRLSFLLYGGFIYFDAYRKPVQLNAFRSGNLMMFDGPFKVKGNAILERKFAELKAHDRFKNITLSALRKLTERFAWITPEELAECPMGAFAYEYSDPSLNRVIKLQVPSEVVMPVYGVLAEDCGIQVEFLHQKMRIVSISMLSPLVPLGLNKGLVILKMGTHLISDVKQLSKQYKSYRKGQAMTVTYTGFSPSDYDEKDEHQTGWFRMPSTRKAYRNSTQPKGAVIVSMLHLRQQALIWESKPQYVEESVPEIFLEVFRLDYNITLHGAQYRISIPINDKNTCNTPEIDHVEIWGNVSAWSHVNLGLESQRWVPSDMDAFLFCYPPNSEDSGLTTTDPALDAFLSSGAFVYFTLNKRDKKEGICDDVEDFGAMYDSQQFVDTESLLTTPEKGPMDRKNLVSTSSHLLKPDGALSDPESDKSFSQAPNQTRQGTLHKLSYMEDETTPIIWKDRYFIANLAGLHYYVAKGSVYLATVAWCTVVGMNPDGCTEYPCKPSTSPSSPAAVITPPESPQIGPDGENGFHFSISYAEGEEVIEMQLRAETESSRTRWVKCITYFLDQFAKLEAKSLQDSWTEDIYPNMSNTTLDTDPSSNFDISFGPGQMSMLRKEGRGRGLSFSAPVRSVTYNLRSLDENSQSFSADLRSELDGFQDSSGCQVVMAIRPVRKLPDSIKADDASNLFPKLRFCNGTSKDERPPSVRNVSQVIQQEELMDIPKDSNWRALTGGKVMSWVPPFGFGETRQYMYGGLLFMDDDGKVLFYSFHGQSDRFRPKVDEADLDLIQRHRAKNISLLSGLGNYDPQYKVKTPTGFWSLTDEVPQSLRPARALLALLGRDTDRTEEVISGKGHYEYNSAEKQPIGIPNVVLHDRAEPFTDKLEVNAKIMEDCLGEECKEGLDALGWRFQPKLPDEYPGWAYNEQVCVHLKEWYGGCASMLPSQLKAEVKKVEILIQEIPHEAFVQLREAMFRAKLSLPEIDQPLKLKLNALQDYFGEHYECLKEILESSARVIVSCRRVPNLTALYGNKTWTLSRREYDVLRKSTRIYTSGLLPPKYFSKMVAILSDGRHADFWKQNSAFTVDQISDRAAKTIAPEHRPTIEAMRELIQMVRKDPEGYGFTDDKMCNMSLTTPICSLATHVCVAQPGYLMLDDDNRLQSKPPMPILFICACAPDFMNPHKRVPARQEVMKYFSPPNNQGVWRTNDNYHGRYALREKIMQIWHRVFRACKTEKVTHPTVLPVGLGIFRPKVAVEADAIAVYFEAKFRLLELYSYKFHTVYLNAGGPMNKSKMEEVLAKKRYQFKCHVQITDADINSVANNLARQGIKSCILIPADFIGVLQGMIGSWWECGHHERYTGESHIVAKSTAIIARRGISPIWEDKCERDIIQVHLDKMDNQSPLPVYTYNLGFHNSSEVVSMTFSNMLFVDYKCWWAEGDPQTSSTLPPCLQNVAAMLSQSDNGYMRVHEKSVDSLVKLAKGGDALVWMTQWFFDTMSECVASKSEESNDDPNLDDINAVVIRFDKTTLREIIPESLAHILAAIVDLRCKGLYSGVILCATTGYVGSDLVRVMVELGADNLFAYPSVTNPEFSVRNTCLSLIKSICIHQRCSPVLTMAVYDNRISSVRKLLIGGIDPNYIHHSVGPWAPIHWAAHPQCTRASKAVLFELLMEKVQVNNCTLYARSGVPAGSTIEAISSETYCKLAKSGLNKTNTECDVWRPRLWGLWITLTYNDEEINPKSPVHRLRKKCTADPFFTLWQLYMIDPNKPLTDADWEQYLPETELINYLRYVVVEVNSDKSAEFMVWMDRVVSNLLARLYKLNHPSKHDTPQGQRTWLAWIKESVIVFMHNSQILDVPSPNPFFTAPDGEVWVVRNFPLQYAELSDEEKPPLKTLEICTDVRVLAARLDKATVHWLRVNENEIIYNTEPYDMSLSLRLEAQYKAGLPVVSNAIKFNDDKHKIDVNLNLMVEIKYVKSSQGRYIHRDGRYDILDSRKVIRIPDHVSVMSDLAENDGLINEIRSNRCLLFLGAGFSFPARLPGWASLLSNTADKVCDAASNPTTITISDQYTLTSRSPLRDNSSGLTTPRHQSTPSDTVAGHAHNPRPNEVVMEVYDNFAQQTVTECTVNAVKIRSVHVQVKNLVSKPTLENLEMAAQLLEDACGEIMKWLLKEMLECVTGPAGRRETLNGDYVLRNAKNYQEMAARLLMVKHLPVSGILTTNYDQLLCYCDPVKRRTNPCSVARGVTPQTKGCTPNYTQMIRTTADEAHNEERLTIQIHGSTSVPQSIVLTREGYRGLLHLNPAYSNFLKTAMAGRTLLYMGFSFTDGYFNEIRSELMILRSTEADKTPSSYAVINDKSQSVREFYADHEGVALLSWESEKHGFGVMDRYLEALFRCTHLAAALSLSNVLLFNPQTSPQILLHGQEVEVICNYELRTEYLPFTWDEQWQESGVVVRTGIYASVDDWILVKLTTEKVDQDDGGFEGTIFGQVLGDIGKGRPFYISNRVMESMKGEIGEEDEVYVSSNASVSCGEFTNPGLWECSGFDPAYWQYLIPFSLTVLDTKCHAVRLQTHGGEEVTRVFPHKVLIKLQSDPMKRKAQDTVGAEQLSLDMAGVSKQIMEQVNKMGEVNAIIPQLEHALLQVQRHYEANIANNSKPMDHTMETIKEELRKVQSSDLYEDAAECSPVAEIYQKFNLTEVTSLPLLMTHIGKEVPVNAIRTWIILNAAGTVAPIHSHAALFKRLYVANSCYVSWPYPPVVIVHTGGDAAVEMKYRNIFIEHSLILDHVSFAKSVEGVMLELMKPTSTNTSLPLLHTRSLFQESIVPTFDETVDKDGNSLLPNVPIHSLQTPRVIGRVTDEVRYGHTMVSASNLSKSQTSMSMGESLGGFRGKRNVTHYLGADTGSIFGGDLPSPPDTGSCPPSSLSPSRDLTWSDKAEESFDNVAWAAARPKSDGLTWSDRPESEVDTWAVSVPQIPVYPETSND